MTRTRNVAAARSVPAVCTILAALACSAASAAAPPAELLLEMGGVKGGLIVHVGCGDGELTVALASGESWLVHGLDTDGDAVDRARERIRGGRIVRKSDRRHLRRPRPALHRQ